MIIKSSIKTSEFVKGIQIDPAKNEAIVKLKNGTYIYALKAGEVSEITYQLVNAQSLGKFFNSVFKNREYVKL
jgi:hypothetical protein